jgi:hypothetical protein
MVEKSSVEKIPNLFGPKAFAVFLVKYTKTTTATALGCSVKKKTYETENVPDVIGNRRCPPEN